ncbi:MAG: hypothetical protein JXA93_23185 [Anaerolineae bacterium]|nr:hypothetical protein [Anaerolineae bacterium]
MEEERKQILEMLGRGQISVEDAERLLRSLDQTVEEPGLEGGAEVDRERRLLSAGEPQAAVPPGEAPESWRRFWIWPFLAGGAVLLIGALILGLVYVASAAAGWRLCGWLPMIVGLVVMVLAWWSRTATWLHLRISERGSRAMAISLPLPLTLSAWVLRLIRPYVPQLRDTGVDELILALRDSKVSDEPLFIDVQDKEEGERVQIYLG